jgi:hypothetical protein
MEPKAIIRDMLARADIGVLATSGPEGPLCSLMAFAALRPDQLIMATLPDTRKGRNIAADPRLSLLVDDRDTAGNRGTIKAVTLAGRHEPPSPATRQAGLALLQLRHPHLAALLETAGVELICMRITSALLLNGPTEAVYLTHPEADAGQADSPRPA